MGKLRREYVLSLALAAVVFCIAALLAWYALAVYNRSAEQERRFLVAKADAERNLHTAQDQLDLADRVSGPYFALQGAGIFTPINKPVAIDRAEALLKPYAVAVTHYQIGGSHETAPAPDERAAHYQLAIERVAIEFEPLHEERFLQVWSAISALRGPVGSVENCEMHRPPEATAQDRARLALTHDSAPSPVKARCLLTWYRLQPAATDPAAGATGGTPMLLAPSAPGVHS